MKFKSKKSAVNFIIIWSIAIILLLFSFIAIKENVNTSFHFVWEHFILLILSLVLMISGILMISVWFNTYYIIQDDCLVISFIPFRKKYIQFKQVESVVKGFTALAGPALSSDRLTITEKGGNLTVISPDDQSKFIQQLKNKCPKAYFDVLYEDTPFLVCQVVVKILATFFYVFLYSFLLFFKKL